MDQETLIRIGLTPSQAKAYLVLVQDGSITPPQLALKTKETRTNAYKILERLAELQLAVKDDASSKSRYRVGNPIALEVLATKQRNEALKHEKRVKDALPLLLSYFYTYSEQPGVRFFQGQDGISQIFDDMLRTRKDVYLIRSLADDRFFDITFFDSFRAKRAKLGIRTFAITPEKSKSPDKDPAIDAKNKFSRSVIPQSMYSASVEWDVYGDKLAIISYGEEAIGMIIESPQIAEGFRQLFKLAQPA
jgi:sugar-specific transcriptional regulator TrmB